jgi:hypothetical protein
LPVGISQAGAWKYAFIYELTHRHFPTLIDQASHIFESDAYQRLTIKYYESVGAAPLVQLMRLFGWKGEQPAKAIKSLQASGRLATAFLPGQEELWIGLPQLLEESQVMEG